ncbi:MAG: peptide chain release factor N(5)-glutamine methyltransferase [Planctomycetes bacterium]|nr:peptide chain release factor N(5)-glutamine methyltransferase [Planctomycetota bacterium]
MAPRGSNAARRPPVAPAADIAPTGLAIGLSFSVPTALGAGALSLAAAGVENPRLDAEVLLSHALGLSRAQLLAATTRVLSPAETDQCGAMFARRARHEPVAYITGRREFMGLSFHVSPDVLIPRPETETLVEWLLETVSDRPSFSLLDLGVGSGAIALSVAARHPGARVTGVDLSPAAAAVARGNARDLGVSRRVRVLTGDLFAPVAGRRFDVVAANPPYVPRAEAATLPPDVRDYEPPVALYADDCSIDPAGRRPLGGAGSGLAITSRIIAGAPDHLLPGGSLFLETAENQAAAVAALGRAAGFTVAEVRADAAGVPRVVRCAGCYSPDGPGSGGSSPARLRPASPGATGAASASMSATAAGRRVENGV